MKSTIKKLITSTILVFVFTISLFHNTQAKSNGEDPVTIINSTVSESGINVEFRTDFDHYSHGIEYGTSTDFGMNFNLTGNYNALENYNLNIRDLEPGINYFYRIFATNASGTLYSTINTFILPNIPYYDWTVLNKNNENKNWEKIFSSGDESKIFGITKNIYTGLYDLFLSVDNANSWTRLSEIKSADITVSNDGMKLAYANYGGYIYTSTDGGVSWTERQNAGQRYWQTITSDSSGSYIYAADSNHIYKSINGGNTWIEQANTENISFHSIISSSNGNNLIGINYNDNFLYISTDGGNNWTVLSTPTTVNKITSSLDLTKLYIIGEDGYVYKSLNSGLNWTQTNALQSNSTLNIKSSPDGEKLAIYILEEDGDPMTDYIEGYIYTSIDSGDTWEQEEETGLRYWESLTILNDGTILAGNIFEKGGKGSFSFPDKYNGFVYINKRLLPNIELYSPLIKENGINLNYSINTGHDIHGIEYGTSTDFGLTSSEENTFILGDYFSNVTDILPNTIYYYRAFATNEYGTSYSSIGTFIYDYQSWIESNLPTDYTWESVTSSGDGTKLAAVVNGRYIYTSTNGGVNWIEQINAGQRGWNSIDSSEDGMKLVAVDSFNAAYPGGYIYTSTDGGVNWTERQNSGRRFWSHVTMSSNGMRIAAITDWGYGYIYTSTDGGDTWIEQVGSGEKQWSFITSSADGTRLTAAEHGGYIYTSTDGGVNWIERQNSGQRNWISLASSADGMRLVAAEYGGYIYTSTDGGVNWNEATQAQQQNWTSLASSADGIKLAATLENDYIHHSMDGGLSWSKQLGSTQKNWTSIASSASGEFLISSSDNLYTYYNSTPKARYVTVEKE